MTADPATNLLDWQSVGEPERNSVVSSPDWDAQRRRGPGPRRSLPGPDGVDTIPAGRGRRITDAFLDGEHAVVVAQDQARAATADDRPSSSSAASPTTTVTVPEPGPGGPVA